MEVIQMLTILFMIIMLGVMIEVFFIAVRAAWTITKILVYLIFLPLLFIVSLFYGFVFIALIVMIFMGISALF